MEVSRTNLPPQRYLLVYASGRDRSTPGKPLHTNFKLSAENTLAWSNRTVSRGQRIGAGFPPQQEGLHRGIAAEDIKTVPLIAPGAEARVLVPTNSISASWIQPGFDDASWSAVKTAIKYDLLSGALSYGKVAGTDIQSQMQGRNATAYIRIPFAGTDFSKINDLQLLMRYDDGFVAYLNGQEVARRLAPAALQWNSAAVNCIRMPWPW